MNFPQWLRKRLAKPLPGKMAQIKMLPPGSEERFVIPENAKESSVLLLLFPHNQDYFLPAIKRSTKNGTHKGQIAFPGGMIEETDASPEAAALREATEEIHLDTENVEILGRLTPLYIPVSNFRIQPILAYMDAMPRCIYGSEAEVAEIKYISLSADLQKKIPDKSVFTWNRENKLKAPGYALDEESYLWGASAMILSELEALWNEYR